MENAPLACLAGADAGYTLAIQHLHQAAHSQRIRQHSIRFLVFKKKSAFILHKNMISSGYKNVVALACFCVAHTLDTTVAPGVSGQICCFCSLICARCEFDMFFVFCAQDVENAKAIVHGSRCVVSLSHRWIQHAFHAPST